ncbi:hypothetical protein P3T76_001965 [Phytophthora citrophthora]|uniref:BED-type domain-containing protein n=1 Tax=Phytophthora citrophthora TaxID=4793 RepID=A0AAD9GX70_9STRA|nr:hypothetical protein P3T76_001965 [Phytophthora citrophthora]
MGRGCTMDEWVHFQKLPDEGRVPNSSYWYVLCRHCVAGYEQKQLFNAPARLTGRRSAMNAHLKICPMYATQYKMDQQAKAEAETAAAAASATDVSIAPSTTSSRTASASTGEKRKRRADTDNRSRGGRGKHCMMEEWGHFTRLQDEGYIGKSNFFYALCKHCQSAYDEADENQKPLLVPKKIVGRREKMRKHLSLCPHFKGSLPPLERRLHPRGNGIPPSVVFSALAAGAAAGLGATVAAAADTTDESSSVPAMAPTNSNGSSRLALDEWHYFTRLERKKDSAYYYARCNFCQQAYESAPDSLKASMEPTIVMGRKSNMQTHMAKCLHMPKDASTMAKMYAAGYNTTLGGVPETSIALEANPPSETKRARMEKTSKLPAHSPDTISVHRALVRVLIEHHLPFEWVESDSAKQLFRALVPATDDLLPHTTDLRTRVLNQIHSATLLGELTKLQEVIRLNGESVFLDDAVDTLSTPLGPWPVMMHCNLTASHYLGDVQIPAIDGVITNGKDIASLSFVRAQRPEIAVCATLANNHGLEIARWLDEHIRLCIDAAKLSLAAVVLPYNTLTQRAVGILRAPTLWPQVVFLSDMEDMLQFPLLKLLATAEMFAVVSSLIEVWQLESIRLCVVERLLEMDGGIHASPFNNWESCATLIQVLLDDKTFEKSAQRGAANAKRLVENALNRSLLERVYNLLHAFTNALSSSHAGLTLSETMVQLSALFAAAEGFMTVQLALEVIWEQMEQPLFVLAHALNPSLRLRNLKTTEITKLSTLSDLSVLYFTSLFGHKPISLRGEITAYLHTSQRVFTSEFVGEFPAVDDYFRYLGDNYPSLSMLMQVLHSFSSVSLASRSSHLTQQGAINSAGNMYTEDEQEKLDFLRGRWGIASGALSSEYRSETKSRIGAHNDRSGAAMLNAGVVVDEWKEAMESKLHMRGVDFSLLEDKFDGVEDSDITTKQGGVTAGGQTIARGPTLPSLELDDELAYPSSSLRAEFSMKVPLKDLLKTAEATI